MTASSDIPRQLPLDLPHSPRFARDDIIVGKSNRAAVEMIDLWPDWPSPMVVLCGPKGAGKTHLARAWAERSGAIALNPEDLGSDPNPSPEQLTFLIEDIGGEPFDETALFHLANSVRQRGGSMLLTSSSLPSAWRLDLPDLKSRLLSATAIEIGEPDDALLLAVLGKLFADRQVIVEANVSAYLVTRMERSLCEAVRIAGLLDAVALEKKARITRALAASIFADGDPRQGDLGL